MTDMARPRGHRLSPQAWDDIIRLAGTTLSEVALRADMKRATVSGLLGGHHRASLEHTQRLAAALGVNPETLFPTLRAGFAETAEEVAA